MGEIIIDGVAHRVRVDHGECMGNRVCEGLAPRVFRVDDETNLAQVADGPVDPALAPQVREAVAECPQDAISLERVE